MADHTPSSVLLTGAAGYIGSTLIRRLREEGCQVVALDDLKRGHRETVPGEVPLVIGDIRDPATVREALAKFDRPPMACIHLAALIQVGESVREPRLYEEINTVGTQVVADACLEFGVPALVMASSAAVLRPVASVGERLHEDSPVGPESPYGATKLSGEHTLRAAAATGRMSTVALRLFNVAGAAYGMAERHDPETHLIPLALRAAAGELPPLQIFGNDLPTPDGTCLRDYVHIRDVVEALARSAKWAATQTARGDCLAEIFHVGSGVPHSVDEVVRMCEQVLGRPVPRVMHGRRPGDVPALVANPTHLFEVLGLRPDPDLQRMVRDAAVALGIPCAA